MKATKETCGAGMLSKLKPPKDGTGSFPGKAPPAKRQQMTQEDIEKLHEAETRDRRFDPEGSWRLRWPWVAYDEEIALCFRTISVDEF